MATSVSRENGYIGESKGSDQREDAKDSGTEDSKHIDAGDAKGFTFSLGKEKPEAVMPVDKDAIYYNMNHKRRGIALIFNHEVFNIPSLKNRCGTKVDYERLKKTFKKLSFEIIAFHDLTTEQVSKEVETVSKKDHSDCDCFVMAVLTHGEQGILYAKDTPYKNEMLWDRFTADKCPTLAGKPKLFFIQACQGDRLDAGITLTRTDMDASPSYKIPTHCDFLIAYSTIPGYYSWRNTTKGSWFMQALCQELEESRHEDLLTILTFVNRRVAVDFESNCPDSSVMHAQKQIPCITYMLTRLLKFYPKD